MYLLLYSTFLLALFHILNPSCEVGKLSVTVQLGHLDGREGKGKGKEREKERKKPS